MFKSFFRNFRSRGVIHVIPEQKAQLLISKTIINFSSAVLFLVIATGLFSMYNPLQELILRNSTYFFTLSSITSFVALGTMFVSNFQHFGRVSVKFLRNCYWVMVIFSTVSTSLWISLLGSLGFIDLSLGKFTFIFAAPSGLFLVLGLITRYSGWDFTKLRPFILGTVAFLMFFILSSLLFNGGIGRRSENFLLVVFLLLHIGIVLWDMSVMQKHALFLKAMNNEAKFLIGEESMKFVYTYSINLFWSFVRIVRIIVQLMARNR